MMDQEQKEIEFLKILMQKYGILRNETLQTIANYKSHTRYFQYLATAVIGIAALVTRTGDGYFELLNNRGFWLFSAFAMTTVVSYSVCDVLESLYTMNIVGARLSVLEEQINELADRRLLIWESVLSPRLNDPGSPPVRRVWFPGRFLFTFEFLILLITMFTIPIYSIFIFWFQPLDNLHTFRFFAAGNLLYATICLGIIVIVAVGLFAKNRLWSAVRELAQREVAVPWTRRSPNNSTAIET